MRPARRIKQAEDVASGLNELLSSSIMSQLLQRSLPAAFTAEQEAQLSRCCNMIEQLAEALDEVPSFRTQFVDAMLKQHVACNIGRLVTWVQQQQEQQPLGPRLVAVAGHLRSASVTSAAGSTTAAFIWAAGVHLIHQFAAVAVTHSAEITGARNLAAILTQQLDEAGEACSRNCTCTA
jgi:hypothetical protein